MKKLFKTAVSVIACAITSLSVVGFAACEDIRKLEIDLSVYNYSDSVFYTVDEVSLSVDLYRHLAPKTVDSVLEHVKNGFYNDAVFYYDSKVSSQIMIGDYKIENGALVQNLINGKLPSEIYGEFEYGGTTGSNLISEKGSIGIWRSYYKEDTDMFKSSAARDSGRATWYIPTTTKSDYTGWLCVFGQYDRNDEVNSAAITAISGILASADNSEKFVVYYTGEYDAAKPDENYGLTFHAVTESLWNDNYDSENNLYDGVAVFVSEGAQLACYDYRTITVAKLFNGKSGAAIKTVKVK